MVPAYLLDLPVPGLCESCGKLHGGGCPQPVTGPPPGLLDGASELTPLGAVVEDAANYLAMRGYLDPDAEDYPCWVLAELAGLAREEPCGPLCLTIADGYVHPSSVADHFYTRRQEEWERALPQWACGCGHRYKVIPQSGWPGDQYFEPGPDGLLGDEAGSVQVNAKGRVSHSGACPYCGARFADTVARQNDPQQPLF